MSRVLSPAARKGADKKEQAHILEDVEVINNAISGTDQDSPVAVPYKTLSPGFDRVHLNAVCVSAGWRPNFNDSTKTLTLFPA